METKRGPKTWKRPWVLSLALELPCHAWSNPWGLGQMILCLSGHVLGLRCWGQLICISSSMYPSMLYTGTWSFYVCQKVDKIEVIIQTSHEQILWNIKKTKLEYRVCLGQGGGGGNPWNAIKPFGVSLDLIVNSLGKHPHRHPAP